ncbi:MAG: hypothetical protein ACR2QF_10945, partial [Geminicoccaceae bacterium]
PYIVVTMSDLWPRFEDDFDENLAAVHLVESIDVETVDPILATLPEANAVIGIGATAILSAIWIWNELAIALGLTFSNAQTLAVSVASFRGYASIDWGPMTAASIVAIIPMLFFALIAQKWIVKGLTLGAVK